MNKQKLQNLHEDPEAMAMEIDKSKDERDDKELIEEEDIEFMAEILEESPLLFYGELQYYLNKFLKRVFENKMKDYGFERKHMTDNFATAYWLWLSIAHQADLIEYGTSPRGAWFTNKGKRFRRIVLENENAIEKAADYIFEKYN